MLDTGADLSLFDAEIAERLGLHPRAAERRVGTLGVGGQAADALCWTLQLSVVGAQPPMVVRLRVGFLPRLRDRTGNLLGRDFMEHVDVGLSHAERTLYLGAHAG
jgi:hypothetical protein